MCRGGSSRRTVDRMTEIPSKAVVLRYVEALQRGDIDAVRDSFAEHATWWLPGELPVSGTWRGRDGIIDEFLAAALRYYDPDSVSIEVTNVLAEGEQVALEWITRGRTAGGSDYENFYAAIFVVREGRIEAVREYTDTLHAKKVLFAHSAARDSSGSAW
jgi:ketosteroid isomerase-like protein